MPSYGQSTIDTMGRALQVQSDGRPIWKTAGVTIDWTAVTAVGSDTTLADGRIVRAGDKYIRYGQVLCQVTGGGQGNTVNKYCPYLSTATDGRQTLTRGNCFILNQTVVLSDLGSDNPAVLDGGSVYTDRIMDIAVAGTNNPTFANLMTAFPLLQVVNN